jgi:flagellar assembly factor FliW
MKFKTKLFGELDYLPESVIHLEEGLIGIGDKKRFLLIESEDFKPFAYLQSLDDPTFSLVVINPLLVEQNYRFYIHDDDLRSIDITDLNQILMLALVVLASDIRHVTVNLKAPIVINIGDKRAKQVILLNDDYGMSESLIKPSTLITAQAAK